MRKKHDDWPRLRPPKNAPNGRDERGKLGSERQHVKRPRKRNVYAKLERPRLDELK